MKDFLLKQSTAVRTPVIPEVKQVIDKIKPDYDGVKPYKTNIKEWLKPIIDLSEFHVYPINGITEGLDWWWGRSEYNIWRPVGEYQWVDNKRGGMYPHYVYQSIPSAIDGNYKKVNNHTKVVLDLAYVGSTKVQKIELHDGVEKVFFSLSKSFGIRNIRTGWYFSKTPDKKLRALVSAAKYYNYYAVSIGEEIINNFDIDYVYKKLQTEQSRVCKELNLIPTDSIWFGNTQNKEYKKFMRDEINARVFLGGVYNL